MTRILRLDYREIGWWYWLVSWLLILCGLSGTKEAFALVLALNVVHWAHFVYLERKWTAFSVQVRMAFVLLLAAGWLPGLGWIYWIPAIGLVARLFLSYCLMARTLALMPWNRSSPFSLDLVRRVYLTPPVSGSVLNLTHKP